MPESENAKVENAPTDPSGAQKVGQSILIVEDDDLNKALFKDILNAKGYTLHFASRGPEALELLKTLRPDLIIMDIVVPGISGLDLIAMIRDDDAICDTPILAVTSLPPQLYKDRIMETGCNAFVSKPLSVTTLWATVALLLDENHATDEHDNPMMRLMGGAQ
jgi:two-component system cell cycle response regulator DivK